MSRRGWRIASLALVLAACSVPPQAPTAAASCRLPVIAGTRGQGSGPLQAGFITLPSTDFAPDPGAADGSFYDPALKRWVAAAPPTLSADGLSYAFFDGGTKPGNLELADLKTGTFRLLARGGPWQVVGVGTNAVYVMQMEYVQTAAGGQAGVSRGLWKVPMSGGSPIRMTSDPLYWSWVDSRAVYAAGSTLDMAGQPSPVVRLDLATGKVGMWFESPARTTVLAVDAAGTGYALTEGDDEELWRISAASGPVKVWSGAPDAIHPWAPVAVDGSGIWLSSASPTPQWAIYHYTPSLGLQRVAVFADHPVSVAGACTTS